MSELVCWAALFTAGAYLVCGIPFGLVVALAMGHVDVRQVGSGNIGTTNVAREVGKSAAALTLLLDVGKGLAWMLVSRQAIAALALGGDVAALLHRPCSAAKPRHKLLPQTRHSALVSSLLLLVLLVLLCALQRVRFWQGVGSLCLSGAHGCRACAHAVGCGCGS